MLLRTMAILFGIGFIFIGVAGFLSAFMQEGLLLGYFAVNTIHNIFYIASGVIAIMAATQYRYARTYFQVFGILFGVLTILGFVFNGDIGLMMGPMNMADNFLHLGITIAALFLGFFTKRRDYA